MFRKKSISDELFPFFFESSESDRVFNYLHDSNSIFRAAGINSMIFFGRTVLSRRIQSNPTHSGGEEINPRLQHNMSDHIYHVGSSYDYRSTCDGGLIAGGLGKMLLYSS